MSEKFTIIKDYYDSNRWNASQVANAVLRETITALEYETIVGYPYVAPAYTPPTSLPSVSSSDNGKIMQVIEGDWQKNTCENIVVEPLTATQNGEYVASTGTAYSPVTVDVSFTPTEEKTVIFYDYDGTLLYSYTTQEFLALEEMPSNPSHEGLTAQGWNWSLEEAQDYVDEFGTLDIGQTYITDDGKTRLYITIEDLQVFPVKIYLEINQSVSNGTEIDWGDGSTVETYEGTGNLTDLIYHEYQTSGDYIITLNSVNDCSIKLGISNQFYNILGNTQYYNKNNALKKVEIGLNTLLGTFAFRECRFLTTITIPNTLTEISAKAFWYCESLKTIILPKSITRINVNAFQYCYSLYNIILSSSQMLIDMDAFRDCFSLKKICFSGKETNLGASIFYNCYSLESIYGLNYVAGTFCRYCYNLKKVMFTNTITNISGNSSFENCKFTTITLPNNITAIHNASSLFASCSLLKEVTLPNSITSIPISMFDQCHSLCNTTIPNTVTLINNSAFNGTAIIQITIPLAVTQIGSNAFSNCLSLKKLHIKPITPPTIQSNTFSNLSSDCIIYVPEGTLETYQGATNWSTYATQMQEETE